MKTKRKQWETYSVNQTAVNSIYGSKEKTKNKQDFTPQYHQHKNSYTNGQFKENICDNKHHSTQLHEYREREQNMIAKYLILQQKYLLKQQQCMKYKERLSQSLKINKDHQVSIQKLTNLLNKTIQSTILFVQRNGSEDVFTLQFLYLIKNTIEKYNQAFRLLLKVKEIINCQQQINLLREQKVKLKDSKVSIENEKKQFQKQNENQLYRKDKNQLLCYLKSISGTKKPEISRQLNPACYVDSIKQLYTEENQSKDKGEGKNESLVADNKDEKQKTAESTFNNVQRLEDYYRMIILQAQQIQKQSCNDVHFSLI